MPSRPGGAAGQQARVALQPGGELCRPERRAPGRGQLDSQRHAVQPGAHVRDRSRVTRGQRERGARRAGPGHEQAPGLRRGHRADRPVLGQFQRRHGEDEFARHVQAFPAGGHDADPGALPGQHDHQPGSRSQDVLAVVQHDQQLAGRQRPHDTRHRVGGISFRDPQRLGDGRRNERRIGEGGQLDQPRAVLEAAGGQRRRPQRQPGLTAPSRAGQRHHAGGAQAIQDRGELRPSPHQRAHLRGQPGVPPGRVFGHDHPPGRASSMTRSAGIYPVRQMLTAAGDMHAPS